MKFLFGFILVLNYLLYVVADLIAWKNGNAYGICFIPPLVVFPIAVKIAGHFATSIADRFYLSEWDYFVKQLKWGNNTAVAFVCVFMIIARMGGVL